MENKKKILILVMSCNRPYYKDKEEVIRNGWAKDVLDKKYENVDLWFFTGSEDEHLVNGQEHKIYTKCHDGRFSTFQKLSKTLLIIEKYQDVFLDYDYLVRVNISTAINIPLLVDFIEHIQDETEVWSGTIFLQPWHCNAAPFLSGEVLVLSRYYVRNLLLNYYITNQEEFDRIEKDGDDSDCFCDDGWITKILFDNLKTDYLGKINSFGLLYEPFDELYFQDQYKNFIAVSYKSDDMFETAVSDDNPVKTDIDNKKGIQISAVFEQKRKDDGWYEYWKENIKNKYCRSSLHRSEDAYCDLNEIIGRYVRYLKTENFECLGGFPERIDESKKYKPTIQWDKYFDHIYCLSYVNYKGRRSELERELKRVGILDSGIFSYKYTFSNPFDEFLMKSPTFWLDPFKVDWNVSAFNLAKGHYDCMKEALGLGYKRVLFIEDDIVFLKSLNAIREVLENTPNYDICLYDMTGRPEEWEKCMKRKVNDYFVNFDVLWTTSCYALSTKGMRRITECQESNFHVADFYTNNFSPVKIVNGHHQQEKDCLKRVAAIKNLACQLPTTEETINDHGSSGWVYNQETCSWCGLQPELYNLPDGMIKNKEENESLI